jgi:hypothetical protein
MRRESGNRVQVCVSRTGNVLPVFDGSLISFFFFRSWPCAVLVRGLLPLEATPGLISLLAGKPNASTFPFTSLSFTARSPFDPKHELKLNVDKSDLAKGLQYGDTNGLAGLCNWFVGLQELSHGRQKGEGWRVSIGSGSQDLIYKVRSVYVVVPFVSGQSA